jgi:ADP-heptose:LPS heptosyltransferase
VKKIRLSLFKSLDKILILFVFISSRIKIRCKTSKNRILLIKLAAMGDALCLMPSIRLLHRAFPDKDIHWLTTSRANPGLFKGLGFIKKTIVIPMEPIKLLQFFTGNTFIARSYDMVIDFEQYYKISELIATLGCESYGFHTNLKGKGFDYSVDYQDRINEKYMFLKLVEKVADIHGREINRDFFSAALPEILNNYYPGESLKNIINSFDEKKIIVIHPGSSHNASQRRWPKERFLSLGRELSIKYNIIIAGGPDEVEMSSFFLTEENIFTVLINKLTLKDWFYFLEQKVNLFIGNDAGMLHIAEAANIKTIGIFGPNIPEKWGSINKLSKSVEVELDCRPCIIVRNGEIPSTCKFGTIKCLQEISVDSILSKVDEVISHE